MIVEECNNYDAIIDHLLSLSIEDQHTRLEELSLQHSWAKNIIEGNYETKHI